MLTWNLDVLHVKRMVNPQAIIADQEWLFRRRVLLLTRAMLQRRVLRNGQTTTAYRLEVACSRVPMKMQTVVPTRMVALTLAM